MARLMFSAGMFTALASAMIVRSRGFISGSPPPLRAATVNSLMTRVNTLPRFASAAPFLCLIVCHLEWPDMAELPERQGRRGREILTDAGLRAPGSGLRAVSGSWEMTNLCAPGASGLEPTRPEARSPEPGATQTGRPARLPALGDDEPHIRARVPGGPIVVAEHCLHAEAGVFDAPEHLRDGHRP